MKKEHDDYTNYNKYIITDNLIKNISGLENIENINYVIQARIPENPKYNKNYDRVLALDGIQVQQIFN